MIGQENLYIIVRCSVQNYQLVILCFQPSQPRSHKKRCKTSANGSLSCNCNVIKTKIWMGNPISKIKFLVKFKRKLTPTSRQVQTCASLNGLRDPIKTTPAFMQFLQFPLVKTTLFFWNLKKGTTRGE